MLSLKDLGIWLKDVMGRKDVLGVGRIMFMRSAIVAHDQSAAIVGGSHSVGFGGCLVRKQRKTQNNIPYAEAVRRIIQKWKTQYEQTSHGSARGSG